MQGHCEVDRLLRSAASSLSVVCLMGFAVTTAVDPAGTFLGELCALGRDVFDGTKGFGLSIWVSAV
jgi:hypothetical protein